MTPETNPERVLAHARAAEREAEAMRDTNPCLSRLRWRDAEALRRRAAELTGR